MPDARDLALVVASGAPLIPMETHDEPRAIGLLTRVATANDIAARLPPELLRKGRFDEPFCVDLPDAATRADILRSHVQRRGLAPERFDLPALAALAEQCSGAELEQAIVAAHYGARARDAELDQEALAAELLRTTPLATPMAERIQGLRAWARERDVQPA